MIAAASSACRQTILAENLGDCSRLAGICVGMDTSTASVEDPYAGLFAGLLPPQLGPIVQPLSDLALEAALGRIIERLPPQRLREIVLAGKAVRRVVVVFVA